MKKFSSCLVFFVLLYFGPQLVLAQSYLHFNAGYLIPSGKYAEKSFKEDAGMAGEGFGYSLEFSKFYKNDLGWSIIAGQHKNQMSHGRLEQIAAKEFGGEWTISGDPWSYYFVMPGFAFHYPWVIDVEASLSAGYVFSISPETQLDYSFSENEGQLRLPESNSDAIAVMPSLRFSYPLQNFTVFVRWSTFFARPQFSMTLLDGEEYDVKQNIINMNLGIGIGYRF